MITKGISVLNFTSIVLHGKMEIDVIAMYSNTGEIQTDRERWRDYLGLIITAAYHW